MLGEPRAILTAAGQELPKAAEKSFVEEGKNSGTGTKEGPDREGRGAPRVGGGRSVGRSISIWKRAGFWAGSPGASRSAFVLVLVLVLERCCWQKRRVKPIRSGFPELYPRSGLKSAHQALLKALDKASVFV